MTILSKMNITGTSSKRCRCENDEIPSIIGGDTIRKGNLLTAYSGRVGAFMVNARLFRIKDGNEK